MATAIASKYAYTPLTKRLHQTSWLRSICSNTVLYITFTLSIALAAFLTGHATATTSLTDSNSVIALRTSPPKPLRYNRTFGLPPSPESDAAWASLFPEQGGFFRHPTLAKERSALAVFHQLHCLDGLRQAVWMAHGEGESKNGHRSNEEKHEDVPQGGQGHHMESSHANHAEMMTSPAHMRHCIDLIRQVLMCKPDLTVEVKDKKLGGVTGFGTTHECVDWGSLMGWVAKWESWNQ